MRKFLIFAVLLAAFVAGLGVFLVATTPRKSVGIRIPLGARERALIAAVPESAEAFAVIPTAAALDARLRVNPATRAALEAWTAQHPFPRPWMIGGADLVVWKSGPQTRYSLHLDPLRALLVRMSGTPVTTAAAGPPIDAATVAEIAGLSAKLPPGDALVVQRSTARGSYPPIGRPAVTSVEVSQSEVRLTSVSVAPVSAGSDALERVPAVFPRSAILSVSFASARRIAGDLNRLFGARVSSLLDDGGSIAVYGVDARRLLPRPLGVIALPESPARRATFESFVHTLRVGEVGGVRVRTAEWRTMLLLSFDDSIEVFQRDAFDAVSDSGARWVVRLDPVRTVPILKDLGRNIGLRIAAPHLFRSVRDLDQWIGGLEQAKVVEASDSIGAGVETLRVRIVAK